MKKQPMNARPLLAAALLALAACGADQPGKQPAGAPPADSLASPAAAALPTPAVPPGAVLLDGLYATSEAPGHAAARLFDGDPATGWRTRTGAGPDEGIMLYFSDRTAQRIKSIQAKPLPGSAFGPDAFIQIYVNGQPVGGGAPGDRIDVQDEQGGGLNVRSLFLRFEETGRETSTERSEDDDDILISAFPADGFIGLQALELSNDRGEILSLLPPQRRTGSVAASSTLASGAYGAANLFDARKEFVWVEGNAATSGEGETITIAFDQPVRITALQVWNGYQRSTEHYAANARARDFTFGAQGGPAGQFTLRDDRAGQKIDLPAAVSGRVFELKINSIFPGKKYKDLAISDLLFYDGALPFVLAVAEAADQHGNGIRTSTANSPLADLLDRRVYNVISQPFGAVAQSLILRADGTFVLYSEEETFGDESAAIETSAQTIADGNWQLLEANTRTAKVKVFGKWFDYSEALEYYKGPTSREATKIFSDVLTIDRQSIVGEKMIGRFYRN